MKRSMGWLNWVPVVLLASCGGGGNGSDFGATLGGAGTVLPGTGSSTGRGADGSTGEDGSTGKGTAGSTGSAGGSSTAGGGSAVSELPGHGTVPVVVVTPVPGGSACADESAEAKAMQLDMFIMQDRTGSMRDLTAAGNTKWQALTNAVSSFLQNPRSNGIGAGIAFFSIMTGSGDRAQVSCNVDDYAVPIVPIGTLTGNAPAIIGAIKAVSPQGQTPTWIALQGALKYARSWAIEHPTHRVIVVLSTDGLPNTCNSTVAHVVTAAEDGVKGTPSIKTYVIGLGAPKDVASTPNLNQMAHGGGSGSAFIVNPADANAEEQFVNAMTAIRDANQVGCQFSIPPANNGGVIDMTQASVVLSSGGSNSPLTWYKDTLGCADADGFYYDSVLAPKVIKLCPTTCGRVQASSDAKVQIQFGCADVTNRDVDAGTSGGGGGGSGGEASDASGAGGEPPAGDCFLDGQSCQQNTDCCGGFCTNGVCLPPPTK